MNKARKIPKLIDLCDGVVPKQISIEMLEKIRAFSGDQAARMIVMGLKNKEKLNIIKASFGQDKEKPLDGL